MGEDQMHVGPTFTREEVAAALSAAGYYSGTSKWQAALRRNYDPVEGTGRYTESENFDLVPLEHPSSA